MAIPTDVDKSGIIVVSEVQAVSVIQYARTYEDVDAMAVINAYFAALPTVADEHESIRRNMRERYHDSESRAHWLSNETTPYGQEAVTDRSASTMAADSTTEASIGPVGRVEYADELDLVREHGEWAEEYAGEWVAFVGDKVIAHSASLQEVMESAHAQGIKEPFLVPMPEEEESLYD